MFSIVAWASSPAHAQTVSEGATDVEPSADIIVTGTRQTGITAAESAAPIKIVSQEAMSSVGQPNLNQVLAQLVPSFSTAGFGADSAQLTLSPSLRGLNPNHTLVLVNGKRRPGPPNLQAWTSAAQGGAPPPPQFTPAPPHEPTRR